MLSVIYAECHYAEYNHVNCRYAECHGTIFGQFHNLDKLVTSLCLQVAAQVPYLFCSFYFVKKNSQQLNNHQSLRKNKYRSGIPENSRNF